MKQQRGKKSFATVMSILTIVVAFGYILVHLLFNMTYESDALVMMREAVYTYVNGNMSEKYQWYFQTYQHNMSVESIWIGLLKLTGSWKAVEITGSLLVVLAILMTALTVLNLTESRWGACITFGIATFYVGTCYHSLMPYTHNYGILFPILCLYIYTSKISFYKKAFWLILTAAIGAEIKMTTLIPFLAIAAIESWKWLDKRDIKKALYVTIISIICFGGLRTLKIPIWQHLGYKPNQNLAVTMPYFLAMGQCTETLGHFDPLCYKINKARQGQPRKETDRIFWRLALQRINERGLWGNIMFFSQKCWRSWGDALMLDHGRTFSQPFMKIVGNTYSTTRQILMWTFYILTFVLLFLKRTYKIIVVYLSLFGVILYQLLFEAQSHYIFMFSPILVLIASVSAIELYRRHKQAKRIENII